MICMSTSQSKHSVQPNQKNLTFGLIISLLISYTFLGNKPAKAEPTTTFTRKKPHPLVESLEQPRRCYLKAPKSFDPECFRFGAIQISHAYHEIPPIRKENLITIKFC